MDNKPKISIITVVFNAVEIIENTIISIGQQTYDNIEYIIIDAASVDGTLEMIKKHQSLVDILISEPDQGIYDAMNKGIKAASGDYVWFINAGDRIYSTTILEDIFSESHAYCDVYYGETMIIDSTGREVGLRRLKAPDELSWKSLINGMLVCHQSFIVKKSIAPNYDTSFKIAADYGWMLLCLKSAESICNTGKILSAFLDGGINKKYIPLSLRERFKIMSRHFGFFRTLGQHFFIGIRFIGFLIRYRRF
jgi:glycosyltransferase involved in cell wall biosynthesis